jgi:hypothetical protein
MFMDMLFDDDEETMDTRVRQTLGEAGYGGVINYFTGLDVSTRIGLSDLIFRDSFIQKDESVFWKLATLAGGAGWWFGITDRTRYKLYKRGVCL